MQDNSGIVSILTLRRTYTCRVRNSFKNLVVENFIFYLFYFFSEYMQSNRLKTSYNDRKPTLEVSEIRSFIHDNSRVFWEPVYISVCFDIVRETK